MTDKTAEQTFDELKNELLARPNSAPVHYNLGLACARRGELDEAIQHFRTALELDPALAAARVNLGGIFLRKGNLEAAIAENRKALEIEPGLISALGNLGFLYVQQGRIEEGIALFEEAIRRGEGTLEASRVGRGLLQVHANLAHACLLKGEVDRAIAANRRALEISDRFAPAHHQLAIAYARQGDLESARKHCREAEALGFPVGPQLKEILSEEGEQP